MIAPQGAISPRPWPLRLQKGCAGVAQVSAEKPDAALSKATATSVKAVKAR